MNILRKIELINIKAFDNLVVDLSKIPCVPNKVNFIVASNGRGKTTIATAFSKLTSNKLDLDKDEIYKGSTDPSLSVYFLKDKDEFVYTADKSKNEISEYFDVFVINSLSLIKAQATRVPGGRVVPSKRLKSQKISILKVGNEYSIKYKFEDLKKALPHNCSKLAVNFTESLKEESFINLINNYTIIKKQKRIIKALDDIKNRLLKLKNGSKEFLNSQINDNNLLDPLIKSEKLSCILESLKKFNNITNNVEAAIALLEIDYLNLSKDELNSAISSFESKKIFNQVTELLRFIDPNKRFFSKVNEELVLEINNIHSLSSGERDLLILIANLARLLYRNRTTKDKILILDDIFDYLDGANILFFQFFILKIIKQYKTQGKNIYIFMFTHTDPSYFMSYQLNKVNIYSLENKSYRYSELIENMICERDNLTQPTSEIIDKYYLHYSIDEFDSNLLKTTSGLDEFFDQYNDPYKFKEVCYEEIRKYIENKQFDIYMVSIGIRILSERFLYNCLDNSKKNEFLLLHGKKKLELFEKEGVDLDPKIEILNKTYNELEHIKNSNKEQIKNRFFLKINNSFIKSIVKSLIY